MLASNISIINNNGIFTNNYTKYIMTNNPIGHILTNNLHLLPLPNLFSLNSDWNFVDA